MPDSKLSITLRGLEQPIDAAGLRELGDGLALLLDAGGWTRRPTVPLIDTPQDTVRWELALDGSDRRRTWRELCLGVTLAITVSRLRPQWLVELDDHTGLLSLGLHRDDNVVLRGGVATRPRRGGPPSPAADRDLELRSVLWDALGDALGTQWGLAAVPPPEPEAGEGESANRSAPRDLPPNGGSPSGGSPLLQGRLTHAAIHETAEHPNGALDLTVTLHNAGAHMVHEVALLVVLRSRDGAPIGVAELELAPLSAGERRSLRRVEALAHPPGAIASVDVQLRGTSRTRTHGVTALSMEPA